MKKILSDTVTVAIGAFEYHIDLYRAQEESRQP